MNHTMKWFLGAQYSSKAHLASMVQKVNDSNPL